MAETVTTFAEMQALLSTLLEDTTTNLYSLIERKRALNNAYHALYLQAANLSDGMAPAQTKATLTFTSGVDTVTMPADFFKLVSVYYESGSTLLAQKPIHPTAAPRWNSAISAGSQTKAFYMRGSSTLVLVPAPNFSGSLTLLYIPIPGSMDADGDVPLFPLGHRELVVYDALRRLAQKEGLSLLPETMQIIGELREAFVRDMEDLQMQESRRLQGSSDYGIYEASNG